MKFISRCLGACGAVALALLALPAWPQASAKPAVKAPAKPSAAKPAAAPASDVGTRTLGGGSHAYGLYALDAKGFDQGLGHGGLSTYLLGG